MWLLQNIRAVVAFMFTWCYLSDLYHLFFFFFLDLSFVELMSLQVRDFKYIRRLGSRIALSNKYIIYKIFEGKSCAEEEEVGDESRGMKGETSALRKFAPLLYLNGNCQSCGEKGRPHSHVCSDWNTLSVSRSYIQVTTQRWVFVSEQPTVTGQRTVTRDFSSILNHNPDPGPTTVHITDIVLEW